MEKNKAMSAENKQVLIVSTLNCNTLKNIILKSVTEFIKKRGLDIYFVIVNKNNSSNSSSDSSYISFNDFYQEKDTIIKMLKEFGNFDFTVQTDEEAIDILGYINSELDLKGIKIDDAKKFRDKVLMKSLLGNDINKPKLYDFNKIDNISRFPIVLKPLNSAGSAGVKIINSKSELSLELNTLNKEELKKYEIEEFISAPICHIDGIIYKSKIVYCSASEYIGNCYEYLKGKPLGSVRCDDNLQQKALLLTENVNKYLKFPDGVFHLEAFLKDNDFIFLEIGIRPGGAEVIPAVEEATGINLSVEHVLLQIGLENSPISTRYKYYGWLNFPSSHLNKNIIKIKSIKYPNEYKLKSLKRKYCPNIGDVIDKTGVVYAQKLGAFIFASNNRDEILNDIIYVTNEFKVEFY